MKRWVVGVLQVAVWAAAITAALVSGATPDTARAAAIMWLVCLPLVALGIALAFATVDA